jgi:S-adenosylmethionine-diacylglycerol 3-amino-3-carboxypropyl transferase
MDLLSNIVKTLQNRLFQSVVSNNLIYNTCWEDPRVDRKLLQLDTHSKVVMLTSAGCNALDYLLDKPQVIHCIDSNPAQNALLELKKSLFQRESYQLLWDFFGDGKKHGAELIYHKQLRSLLSEEAQNFWDKHISYFTPTSNQPSFYFRGTSGKIAHLFHNRLQNKGLYSDTLKLLKAETLEEQRYYFDEVEPQMWNGFHKWLIGRHATMTMLGVPATQQKMIRNKYDGGLLHFIRNSLKKVFTEQPVRENYFWRVYITGSYSKKCCPNYLLEQYFDELNQSIHRIDMHTSTLLSFLEMHPGTYSHFVLLDHQDWMGTAKPGLLAEEWKQILLNSKSGTRILFRSAGATLDFLPDFVFDHVHFQPVLTKTLHPKDRAGTYESTHLGIVQ